MGLTILAPAAGNLLLPTSAAGAGNTGCEPGLWLQGRLFQLRGAGQLWGLPLKPGLLLGATTTRASGEGVLHGTSVGWERGFAEAGLFVPVTSPSPPHHVIMMTTGGLLSLAAEGVQPCCNAA